MTHRLEAAVLALVTLLAVTLAVACYRTELEPLGLKDIDAAWEVEVAGEPDGESFDLEIEVQPDPSPDDQGPEDQVEEADEEPDLYDAEEQAPSIVELLWDDSTCEEGSAPGGDWYPGGMIAVCFTPPSYPCRLVSANFNVYDVGYPDTEFGVRLFQTDGFQGRPMYSIPIPTTTAHAGPEGGWVEVDLSDAGVVIESGDFCVAMEWLTIFGDSFEDTQAQAICADSDSTYQGRSWIYWAIERIWKNTDEANEGPGWNVMIRAFVEVD